MKKFLCILLAAAFVLSMTACGSEKEVAQDTSPITMLVSQGNGKDYYTALAKQIKTDLGISVEFVYQACQDTSNMTRLYFANNDLPADIIFTASKTDDALLKDCCVDLLSRTSLTANYTSKTINDCTTEEGAVYQLPVTSRLIGITYNETLLNEMGWEVPQNFEDMLDLKAKCDAAGIKFAVSDGVATGHGFNWLFHLMGSQWLSTLDGTQWLEAFQSGSADIEIFKEKCEYFKKWTQAGLWGSVRTKDWNGGIEFSKTRALFWYGLVNTLTGYEGPMYDDNGNETGVMLNDTYKSIPWISEDGSNNCYTYYDSCWVYLNKDLEAADKKDKLANAVKVLNYIVSSDATKLVSDMAKDTYVSVSNYEIGDDRLYAAYNESIKNGFVQPWYYNWFDSDSIVYTGEKINNYITGKGSFDEIFETLDKYNKLELASETEVLADFPEGLGFEDTAKLLAVSCAKALDMSLAASGSTETAEVAIIPYTTDWNQLQPWSNAAVSNSIVYPGKFDASMYNTVMTAGNLVGIRMTGLEIKAIMTKQYDPSDRYIDAATERSTYDSSKFGPYPYVCLVKGNAVLEDNKEYLVALCDKYLTAKDYGIFEERGSVIKDFTTRYTPAQGLKAFAAEHQTITAADLILE